MISDPFYREDCPACEGTGEIGNDCPYPSNVEPDCCGCNIDCEKKQCCVCDGHGYLDPYAIRAYYQDLREVEA